ncbi:glycosyltransferase family 2 protein [Flavobacterium sp. MC2016-06]|jgi:glycosyltransferase involved in cell wall biosynthesis|uniref:tetratricopeptide repeat-containing glycosyltransferase family 2 protein n=1 Tax=Flavobacterium sp. MC2016-06 TaxID=2676308 RepID=UPI0012BAF1D1|nr:glycosyltransferase family 2 protein [Flavobacterium sp. MC2016-06]MBU3858350.1 glycosyltransferase family 2 protein [Flavobacterium sp. MC2016-06]
MITISLCLIVKNEEKTLAGCLNSIKDLVEEIIIVDTGSTDRTKEIALSYTDKVYHFDWINDFSAARNFAFSKATMDYQLWLDADDVLLEKDQIAFRELKQTLSLEIDMVLMKYHYVVDANNNPVYCFYRERLVKRANNYKWNDPVHEYIEYGGNYIISDIAVTHKKIDSSSDRNLKIYEEQLSNNIPLSPRSLYYYAKELRDHQMYEKAVKYFKLFLETEEGSIDECINACLEIGKIYKLHNNISNALHYFFNSFHYDLPKGEACCEIAKIYKDKKDYLKAIYWYELILSLKPSDENISITKTDSWNFTPKIELCVCYYNIGNLEKAIYYNELAGEIKGSHESVLYNRKFLKKFKHEKETFHV